MPLCKKKHSLQIWVYLISTIMFAVHPLIIESVAAERPDLIEGAKKEGELLYYTAMPQAETNVIVRKFMEKYPFIRAKFFYNPTNELLVRILAELRANKLPADVIQIGGVLAEVVRQNGGMGEYVSPELEGIPDELKDPKGHWGSSYIQTNVIAYNTRLVKGKDIPKSYQDLLNPKWKGKMAFARNEVKWLIAQLGIMGEEKGLRYMRQLAEQDLKLFPSKVTVMTMLAAGEVSIAVNSLADLLEKMKQAGASVDWVAVNPVHTTVIPIFVAKNPSHPNAAKLFVNFVLSKEGAMAIKSINFIPSRPDVPPDPPRLTQGITFYPDKMESITRFDEFNRMFKTIFLDAKGRR